MKPTKITLHIPGVAVPMSTKLKGAWTMCKTGKYAKWKERVQSRATEQFLMLRHDIELPHTGPVSMNCMFYLPRRKGCTDVEHQDVPDADNCGKGVADGCSGILFVDDRQVRPITSDKAYADGLGTDGEFRECGVEVVLELYERKKVKL